MFPRLIALGGVARAGKDTFYQTLAKIRPGAIRISIGDIIRQDCYSFIKKTTGIDVNNCTDKEKEIVRPVLVWYGIVKRDQTQGAYFRDKLKEAIVVHSSRKDFDPEVNYFIMTDMRFAQYAYDEPEWVKDNKGVVVHISRVMDRLNNSFNDWEPIYLKAANDTEAENDPKLKAKADFRIEWPNRNDPSMFEDYVFKFLLWLDEKTTLDKNFRARLS